MGSGKYYYRNIFENRPMEHHEIKKNFTENWIIKGEIIEKVIGPLINDIDLLLKNLSYHYWHNTERYENINLRHYQRENIWSINKDFEEVVVCVVAKNIEGTKVEIAGMGSILEEHVKLFAGILEDVWIQSKKLDLVSMTQTFEPTYTGKQLVKPSEIKTVQNSIPPQISLEVPSTKKKSKKTIPEPKEELSVQPGRDVKISEEDLHL